jgi:N-acetyl-gamma-glutamyl-phosphate reductase
LQLSARCENCQNWERTIIDRGADYIDQTVSMSKVQMSKVVPKVYIDGQAGTTGLRIHQFLAGRTDLEVIEIDPDRRKDPAAREEMLRTADAAILCLPDEASIEAVELLGDADTVVIDASSAFRTAPGWAYGLPEISADQRSTIATSRRIANPGCYPQTVILALLPLIAGGLVEPAAPIVVHALSGYSGGGKSTIEKWEDPSGNLLDLDREAIYAVDRIHKHVPEMHRYSGLTNAPFFVPAVGPFATGMRVRVALHHSMLTANTTAADIHSALMNRYETEPFITVGPLVNSGIDDRALDPHACDGTNRLELHVLANPSGHVLIVGLLDNLGKGAGGCAVQNLNLALNLGETSGLNR